MAQDPLKNFKNESRLLSEDEQELIGVLARFYEHIESLNSRVTALEALVEAIVAALGSSMIVVGKKHD